MNSTASLSKDSEVHISRDNQGKINTFAIRNGWLEELTVELRAKQNELKNLEDAEGDIMLLDEEDPVPIMIGDSYVYFSQEKASEKIQQLMDKVREDIKKFEGKISKVKSEMSTLKSELYSRFGDNINLENEED